MPHNFAPFVTKLSFRMALPISDQQALFRTASAPRRALKGECLIEEGAELSSLLILCSGMARAVRTFSDGNQQIVAVFVEGDSLNAGEIVFRQSRRSVYALTDAICLSIPLRQLNELMNNRPAIARALWFETAAQAAIQQEWMVWLGQRTAQTRLAHFLCEVSHRLQLSGRGARATFEFPLTQRDLADTLGLSSVHINRTMQTLRSQGLIELTRTHLTILDREGLYAIAEFDPQYLDGVKLFDEGAI
ncbi:Crp/Fnr family transcriptional regulator [Bradyrhizobium sp. Arg816]|uniref:Crp/Fnr family transcriptional regulator n=1 Tax=Bradyrhizobium sp. Arg816 TaxID=2998491 RepID=UPI00249F2713|nr:Crp/Fnr family transcriptional regulator [Bradyrhizobium sp. Arg816]MDI3561971.1 Crp/Fnr family transcriptional regulator [Bradyrhizobium sp. Arg816]